MSVSAFFDSEKTEFYRLDIMSELETRIEKKKVRSQTIAHRNVPIQISPGGDGPVDSLEFGQ